MPRYKPYNCDQLMMVPVSLEDRREQRIRRLKRPADRIQRLLAGCMSPNCALFRNEYEHCRKETITRSNLVVA